MNDNRMVDLLNTVLQLLEKDFVTYLDSVHPELMKGLAGGPPNYSVIYVMQSYQEKIKMLTQLIEGFTKGYEIKITLIDPEQDIPG